jgi:hypothetical protein
MKKLLVNTLLAATSLWLGRTGVILAQDCPPIASVAENLYCLKEYVCRGAATLGQCSAHGVFCQPDTHSQYPCDGTHPNDGCSWSFIYNCWGPAQTTCTTGVLGGQGSDCGGKCTLISYNQCACKCEDWGLGSIEAGCYWQCW